MAADWRLIVQSFCRGSSEAATQRVPLPSTPVRVVSGADKVDVGMTTTVAEVTHEATTQEELTSGVRTITWSVDPYTCPTCTQTIVEATNDREGQEVLLCEGNCNTWYHSWCAGVPTLCYEPSPAQKSPSFVRHAQLIDTSRRGS